MKSIKIFFLLIILNSLGLSQTNVNIFDIIRRNDQNALKGLVSNNKISTTELDSSGNTPLIYSIKNKRFECAKIILEKGNSANQVNYFDKKSSLHLLCENSSDEQIIDRELSSMCKILLDSGANLNYQDKNGDTPLHAISKKGNISILNLLLEYYPNIYLKNKKNQTAADIASGDAKSILSQLDKNIEYKLRLKIKECDSLYNNLRDTKSSVISTIKNFEKEIKEIETQIKNEKYKNNYRSYKEAQNNKSVSSALTLIQIKMKYIFKLKEENLSIDDQMVDLDYIRKKTYDELKIYKTLGDDSALKLISQIDKILDENRPRNDKVYNEKTAIDIPLKEIYDKIK
jgi:hypothetical protein